jgi:photosystem II stability/assembly factor-like uncharacterized protein
MKHLLKLVVFTLFLSMNVFAQDGWFWQNPLPQGNTLNDIFVFDENEAIAVDGSGTVIKTVDSGDSWTVQHET